MNFQPLHDSVVLKLDARKTMTESGIFVGDMHDKTRRGIIVAVGSKRNKDGTPGEIPVSIGDVVLFEKSHANVEQDGVMYFFVKEDQIVAVFEG